MRQGGYKWRPEAERFEAVDLARLKITKWWQNCRQIKTFPLKSLHYFRHPSLRPPAAATLPDSRTDGIWRMSEYYREEARRKIQRRNRNEIGCRQRGQEKSDRCPHLLLMLWFELMRTPCPSTACGLQMNSCCIFDKLAYDTINNNTPKMPFQFRSILTYRVIFGSCQIVDASESH